MKEDAPGQPLDPIPGPGPVPIGRGKPATPMFNIANEHAISRSGRYVWIQYPVSGVIIPDQAVRAAAWLLVSARPKDTIPFASGRFLELLDAIINS